MALCVSGCHRHGIAAQIDDDDVVADAVHLHEGAV
jgi:hypothetical protein